MNSLRWFPLSVAAAIPISVCATSFTTADEFARRSFPAATAFHELLVNPTPEEARALAAPGAPPRLGPVRTIEAVQGDTTLGRVVIDAVIGKFEQIDYAVALGTDGRVMGLEILTYRESHGAEVRLPAWRGQFTGKGPADPIHAGADIALISGATLSCTHITDGVRRIVAWAARRPPAAKT
ncbi:MAG: FMN-binding protein [Burkholderiaceae bacterium]